MAGLRHGDVAVLVHGQQHPTALLFLCPAPVYHNAVVFVQHLRVRQSAAQPLHVQRDGTARPLFRHLEVQGVHLGRAYAAHVQGVRRCPEGASVVL